MAMVGGLGRVYSKSFISSNNIELQLYVAPPPTGAPPSVAIYVLDPEPALFGLMALQVYQLTGE